MSVKMSNLHPAPPPTINPWETNKKKMIPIKANNLENEETSRSNRNIKANNTRGYGYEKKSYSNNYSHSYNAHNNNVHNNNVHNNNKVNFKNKINGTNGSNEDSNKILVDTTNKLRDFPNTKFKKNENQYNKKNHNNNRIKNNPRNKRGTHHEYNNLYPVTYPIMQYYLPIYQPPLHGYLDNNNGLEQETDYNVSNLSQLISTNTFHVPIQEDHNLNLKINLNYNYNYNQNLDYKHNYYFNDNQENEIFEKLIKQLKYYFSIENLCKDIYLRKHMDCKGFVLITFIGNFTRVKNLLNGKDIKFLYETFKEIEELEMVGIELNTKIRLKVGWDKWIL